MDLDEVSFLLDVLSEKRITPHALQVMLFLNVPRRPQVMLDNFGIDRGSLNKLVRKNSRYMSRRILKDRYVSRGRGKLPIEYHLTEEGEKLIETIRSYQLSV